MEAKRIVNKFLVATLLVAVAVSCRTEDSTSCSNFKLIFTPTYHGNVVSEDSVYRNSFEQRFRIETARCYLSEIYLHKSNGDSVLVKDIALYNFLSEVSENLSLESNTYTGLSFGVGIPANKNKNVDPSTYSNASPLSVQGSNGMFWYWNTGYIFMKFDGHCDTTITSTGDLLQSYAYHVGDDPLYRHVSFNFPAMNVGEGIASLQVKLALDSVLDKQADPVDLRVDYLTHTTANFPLAERIMNHFVSGFHLP
jgi:hypothetical protein